MVGLDNRRNEELQPTNVVKSDPEQKNGFQVVFKYYRSDLSCDLFRTNTVFKGLSVLFPIQCK